MPRRPPSRLKLFADKADAGKTLLQFLAARGGLHEPDAREAIVRGGAFVDQRRERDPGRAVRAGAVIEVSLREHGQVPQAPPALEASRILHLDEAIVAVDKPAGVLAQEGRAGGSALPDLVGQHLGGKAFLVHRLDRGTTGVTVLARTRAAQTALLQAFREGRAEKVYLALCSGKPALDAGLIDLALGDDPSAPGKRHPDPSGEPAHTQWRILERFHSGGDTALIEARPTTGRTHQVRVHLAAIGCPLLGDARYGGRRALTAADGRRLELQRPLLHALSLRIPHPAGGHLEARAPEPADFVAARAWLRSS